MSRPLAFSDKTVRSIREGYREGASLNALAARFSVNRNTIFCLLKGKTYVHVADPLGPIAVRPRGRPTDRRRNAIGRERIRLGLTVGEAANRLGMPQSTYSVTELATGRRLTAPMLERFRRAGYDIEKIAAEMEAVAEARDDAGATY
jgi:plasmid maintenance system antidote protein VapI